MHRLRKPAEHSDRVLFDVGVSLLSCVLYTSCPGKHACMHSMHAWRHSPHPECSVGAPACLGSLKAADRHACSRLGQGPHAYRATLRANLRELSRLEGRVLSISPNLPATTHRPTPTLPEGWPREPSTSCISDGACAEVTARSNLRIPLLILIRLPSYRLIFLVS